MGVCWVLAGRLLGACWVFAGCLLGACRVLAGCLLGALAGCWQNSCWVLVGCLLGVCWVLAGFLLAACWVLAGCLLGACWVFAGCLRLAGDAGRLARARFTFGRQFLARAAHGVSSIRVWFGSSLFTGARVFGEPMGSVSRFWEIVALVRSWRSCWNLPQWKNAGGWAGDLRAYASTANP